MALKFNKGFNLLKCSSLKYYGCLLDFSALFVCMSCKHVQTRFFIVPTNNNVLINLTTAHRQTLAADFYRSLPILAVLFYYCPHCLPPLSGGQAGNKSYDRALHKQSTKFKEAAIICCKEKKMSSPPNGWHNIPI